VRSQYITKYYTGPENLDRICCVPEKVMLMENKYKRISKALTTKALNQWKIKVFYRKENESNQGQGILYVRESHTQVRK